MPKITVTNLLTGPIEIADPSGLPGADGTVFTLHLDEAGHAGGTYTKSKSATKEQLERLAPYLDAAQTASKITWAWTDDSSDAADNARVATRVAVTSPIAVAISDETVISKLTVPGAVAVSLPASPPVGMVVEVCDGTGDASSNNITITPAAGTINGGANLVINTNYGRARLVRTPTEWIGVLTASLSSAAAGGDLTGTYPNPTIGANKVTEAKLAITLAGASTTLAGAGAVDVTHRSTNLNPAGALDAVTLANGTIAGQRKTITNISATHTARLTPDTPTGFAHIDFTAQWQSAELEWNGSAWEIKSAVGVTVA